jgi:hypothetical protein
MTPEQRTEDILRRRDSTLRELVQNGESWGGLEDEILTAIREAVQEERSRAMAIYLALWHSR